MSDTESEFQEWFVSQGQVIGEVMARTAWFHQQKEIDRLRVKAESRFAELNRQELEIQDLRGRLEMYKSRHHE